MFGVLLIYLIPFPQFIKYIYIICKESMHLDKDCLNINKYQRYKHKHSVKIKQKKMFVGFFYTYSVTIGYE